MSAPRPAPQHGPGLWADQGDGTSLLLEGSISHSAIADGLSADVLSTPSTWLFGRKDGK